MEMGEYAARRDILSSEEGLFQIPLRKEYLLSRIGRGKRVLDLGCLGGKISKLIQDRNNDVWCVELNAAAAELAKSRGLKVKVANVEEGIPFESESFDVVNAGELIEQIYDTKAVLLECARVLKRGGTLFLATPNLNSLENRIRVLTGGYLATVGAYPEDHFGEHVRVFNRAKLNELLQQCGFQIREVRGIPTLRSRGRWLDRGLGWVGRVWPDGSQLLVVRAERHLL